LRRSLAVLVLAAAVASCGDTRPTAAPDSAPSTTVLPSTSSTTIAATVSPTVSPTVSRTVSRTVPPTSPPVTAALPVATSTPYVIPVANASGAGWGGTHSAYPATDIFDNGCGGGIVSPVNGVLLEVRRDNGYDPATDNPATRGGRSISILGDDGVRYYLAHFELIDAGIEPGVRVDAGAPLGTIGTTGRSSACHVHFGISPPCPEREWSVRRGVVWPYRYLDDWRNGGQASPVEEIAAFVAEQPNACSEAAADPNAADA